MTLGSALFDSGDLVAARGEFEAVLRDAPHNVLAGKLLAECLARLPEQRQAEVSAQPRASDREVTKSAASPEAGSPTEATPTERTTKWWRRLWGEAPPAARAASETSQEASEPPAVAATLAAMLDDSEEKAPLKHPDDDLPPIPLVPADESFELAPTYELPEVTRRHTASPDTVARVSDPPPPPLDFPPLPEPPREEDKVAQPAAPSVVASPATAIDLLSPPSTEPRPASPMPDAATPPSIAAPSLLPQTGSLAETDFPDLIRTLHERRWTGTIELHRGRIDGSVRVQEGRLVFASSTNRDDRLGELLLRRELITLSQYYDASKAIRKGKRLGTILVEMGALAAQDLISVVVDQTQEIIYGVFLWTEGFYRLREGANTDPETITLKLSTADIILEGIRRIPAWSRIERGVGGAKARYVRADDWQRALRTMTLTPHRLLLLSGHEGEREVETICRESRLSSFEVCRTIWAFRVIGVLRRVQTPVAS